jgi:endonuclease/exonuclease/phosphatase family metal-dependent hydrolase
MTHNTTQHMNIGTELHSTAILTKHGITQTNIKRLPCGRGIAGLFQNTWIINVYAPSGAEKRDARECFYTTDIISLLPLTRQAIILAGDFNCVLRQIGATGRKNVSKALDILVSGLKPHDAYGHIKTNPIFTHCTTTGASRIDRNYISENIHSNRLALKQGLLPSRTILQ